MARKVYVVLLVKSESTDIVENAKEDDQHRQSSIFILKGIQIHPISGHEILFRLYGSVAYVYFYQY
jgi:hypothetical protein